MSERLDMLASALAHLADAVEVKANMCGEKRAIESARRCLQAYREKDHVKAS